MRDFHGGQSLIQSSTLLPGIAIGPVKSGAPALALSGETSGFALALGALMPQRIALPSTPKGTTVATDPVPATRQDVAEGGKDLPESLVGIDDKGDGDSGEEPAPDRGEPEDAPPPAFPWFAAAPIVLPQPVPAPTPVPAATAPVAPRQAPVAIDPAALKPAPSTPLASNAGTEAPIDVAPAPARARQVASAPVARQPDRSPAASAPSPAPTQDAPLSAAPPVPPVAAAPVAAGMAPSAATVADLLPSADKPGAAKPPRAAAVDIDLEAIAAPTAKAADAPVPAPVTPAHGFRRADAPVVRIEPQSVATPAPAQARTAADLATIVRDVAPAPAEPRNPAPAGAEAAPAIGASTAAQTAAAVLAPAQDDRPMLDTRKPEWMHAMIERIETLRDGAGPAREAKLSLVPEALGRIDIAIRHDEGGLHVQFNTETHAARELIAEAQPKLAEIAESRGLRIGSTSVDSSGVGGNAQSNGQSAFSSNGQAAAGWSAQSGSGQRQDGGARQSALPAAPARAHAHEDPATDSDERVA